MKSHEPQLQMLYENGMIYSGVKKEFVGKADYHRFSAHSGMTVNKFGYYCYNDSTWVVFVTDEERGIQIQMHEEDTEEKAILYLLELAENCNFSYYYQTIVDDFSAAKRTIILYLKEKHGYSDAKAMKVLDQLLQVRSIAFEYWYLIEHGEYVPDKFATCYAGYTAKLLQQEFKLSDLEAFNCLVRLKDIPGKTLAELKKR